MTRLVIGTESIEISEVKGTVEGNMRLIEGRLKSLPLDSAAGRKTQQVYTALMDAQARILEWLGRYENNATVFDAKIIHFHPFNDYKKAMYKKFLVDVPPILNFEASSLSDCSYPISAGLVVHGQIHYWLIKPNHDWIDWDTQNQAVHGLSRFFIEKNGIPPQQVFEEISLILAEETVVYSNNPDCEKQWMSRLGKLDVEIKDVKSLLPPMHQDTFEPQLKNTFKLHDLIQHRADHDALAVAITLNECLH